MEETPNPAKINALCEEIKNELEILFNTIKLKTVKVESILHPKGHLMGKR